MATTAETTAVQFGLGIAKIVATMAGKRHLCAAKEPTPRPVDALLEPVRKLEQKMDRAFSPTTHLPIVSLSFRGGRVSVLRAPTGETSNLLEIDGRVSHFSVGIGAHGLFGFAVHRSLEGNLDGTLSVAAIEKDIREAQIRVIGLRRRQA